MPDYLAVLIYFAVVVGVTLVIIALSALIRPNPSKIKSMPYESGIQTEAHLLQDRFPIRHYLVALIFLVFDIEVIFLYPWAVIAKTLGDFAFYEMVFFLIALFVGFAYVWRKGGLQWQ